MLVSRVTQPRSPPSCAAPGSKFSLLQTCSDVCANTGTPFCEHYPVIPFPLLLTCYFFTAPKVFTSYSPRRPSAAVARRRLRVLGASASHTPTRGSAASQAVRRSIGPERRHGNDAPRTRRPGGEGNARAEVPAPNLLGGGWFSPERRHGNGASRRPRPEGWGGGRGM